jgi:multisubunit Na+/H+ antiporter MnhC subunit
MRCALALLGEKVVLVFRYSGCSATSGWTLTYPASILVDSVLDTVLHAFLLWAIVCSLKITVVLVGA